MKNIFRALPFILILAFAFFVFTQKNPEPAENTEIPQIEEKAKNAIKTGNQNAGSQVLIDEVTLENPGFAAVYTLSEGLPQPENIIGVSSLLSGTQQNVVINLDQPITDGDSVTIILHTDDGNGEFGFPETDPPLNGPDGGIMSSSVSVLEGFTNSSDLPALAE